MNRALFVDRDGVINELVWYPDTAEWAAPRTVADIRMVAGSADALERAAGSGWTIFVVTNQPDYAKGRMTMEELESVHAKVVEGLPIRKSYVCIHHPDAVVPELRQHCACRKPSPQPLHDAAREFEVDLKASWMIGDRDTDLACGRSAGCRVALVENPHSSGGQGTMEPDLRGRSLAEILKRVRAE